MFDMKSIGRKIASLRKEKGFTQMELADRMGVSFQAISNWERGETMPDISKLPALSELFGVSIDTLLGRTRHTRIIENILEGSERDKPVTADEFEEIVPILTSEQADVIIKEDILEGIEEEDGIDVSQLKKIACHLDEDDLAALSIKILDNGGRMGSILPFACYMGEDGLARVVNRAVALAAALRR